MKFKWIFIVVVLCLFVNNVSAIIEFEDTMQYHLGTDLSDIWTSEYTYSRCWNDGGYGSATLSLETMGGYPYLRMMRLYTYGYSTRGGGSNWLGERTYFYVKEIDGKGYNSNYWSFVVQSYTDVRIENYGEHMPWSFDTCVQSYYGGYSNVYLQFYDSDYMYLGSGEIATYINTYHNCDLFEIQIEGNEILLSVNGDAKGCIGAISGGIPFYMYFNPQIETTYGSYYGASYTQIDIDDVTTNDGIVGVGAEPVGTQAWIDTHAITQLNNYEIDASWHVTAIPFAEYTNAQYDFKVRRATWDQMYNVTRLKDAGNSSIKPCGNLKFNWSELFNQDHFGLYWFEVYKTETGEPELLGGDWIYFKDIGEPSTINIEDTEYAIGETLNISYYIDSPDFGANQYKIQIFDSTGQLKDERVLTQQAATEQITSTIDWEEGMLYAVLVKDTKPAITEDPPEDIRDLAYDFCTLSNVIYISGKVYDASNSDNLVDGTLLANVNLNWTQAGTNYHATSDANGSYEFIDPATLLEVEWFQDVPIEVRAEKSGYTHDDFTMTIIKAGRYTVDLYLVPEASTNTTKINGLVQDDIFHQAIPQATVNIWNGISNSTYTNNWGWYEFTGISNGTYYMTAEKETYRTSSVVTVPTYDVSYLLDDCDNITYYESVLDECDNVSGWTSDNNLTLNTLDYIEATGALQSVGYNTTDFSKTFSPGVNSNVSAADGYFYFYSKISNTTNITSENITVTISSNSTGATDKRVWQVNKTYFNNTWDLHVLKLSNSEETGACNLSNITFFKFESTKSDNVTTLIDYLAFIEYAGWDSCLDLSVDNSDYIEGTGSLRANGTLYPECNLVLGMFWTPAKDCSIINKNSDLSRLEYYQKDTHTHIDNVYLFDSDGDYVVWTPEMSSGWDNISLYFKDATENGDFETSKIAYLNVYSPTIDDYDVHYDYVRLVQKGDTRQNFLLSQNYNLTVYAKDADTRYTITSFTAVLDSTRVAETTTGAIVFQNVTYGIYPLEVSANGYYTNKQYVFMGQDTEQTVYLTKIENVTGGGAGTYYPPRAVEFKVQTLWGNAVGDVTVNVTALETSGSSWDWLWNVMGLSQDVSADIENGTMNGTTDSLGRISFMMVETVKYRVQFTKPSENVNTTITIYPKDSHYVIIVGSKKFTRDTEWYEAVDFTVTWEEINNTHGSINMFYDDTSDETRSLLLYINNFNDEGCALEFNGIDSYVDCGHDTSLDMTTEGTLEMWVYVDDNYRGVILGKGNGGAVYSWNYRVVLGSSKHFICTIGNTTLTDGVSIESTSVASENTWTHLMCTWNNTNLTMYINGQYDNDVALSFIPEAVTNNLTLGYGNIWTGTDDYFDGKLDEIRLYNRYLNPTEAFNHYNRRYNEETGLIGLWHFDDCPDTLAVDSSTKNNNGTIYGATWTIDHLADSVWNQYYDNGCNQTNAQIIVNKEGGKAFYVGFRADHVTFGHSPLTWEQVLKFKWFLDIGVPQEACKYLSIAFLVLFACFFGATTVEIGSIFVSMFAWIFHFVGWLEVRDTPTTYLVLSIITAIAVLAYIAQRSRRVYRN